MGFSLTAREVDRGDQIDNLQSTQDSSFLQCRTGIRPFVQLVFFAFLGSKDPT